MLGSSNSHQAAREREMTLKRQVRQIIVEYNGLSMMIGLRMFLGHKLRFQFSIHRTTVCNQSSHLPG
ncbi:hypothetical protein MKX01_009421 [Papaver californicum]|nr:hypothetical protein MKX01_009421 [Papaver californicum]